MANVYDRTLKEDSEVTKTHRKIWGKIFKNGPSEICGRQSFP